jgi:hypothetical protein
VNPTTRSRRRVAGLLTPLLVVIASATLATPAVSQTDERATGREGNREPSLARLVDSSTWLDPDGDIEVTVELDADLPRDAVVEVTLHEALRHRTDLRQSLTRQRLGGRLTSSTLGTVGELVPRNRSANVTATIPIRSGPPLPDQPPRLGIANAGVHPIDVSIIDPDGTRLGGVVTYVVRPPLDPVTTTTKVVVVQPLDAPPSHTVDGHASVAHRTRETWTVLASVLGNEPSLPLVVAPRPETLDALSSAGSLDRALVRDLAAVAAASTIPQSSYVAVDLDGALRAGLGDDLDSLLDRGQRALTRSLGTAPESGLWIAGTDLTTMALGWLVERGIDTLVVPHDALAPLDVADPHDRPTGRPVRISATGASGVVALTTDPLLQQHQGSTGDPRLDAERLVADLALDWFAEPDEQRSLVVVLDDDSDPEFLEVLRATLAASPLLEVVSPADAIDATPMATIDSPSGTSRPLVRRLAVDTSGTDLTQLRRDLDLARLSIASVRSVFPDDVALFARYDTLLAILLSSDLDQADRSVHLVELAGEMDGLLDGIDLPSQRTITLPARDGTIPVTLTNASGRPALVALHLDSEKLDFLDGDRVEISLPDGATTVEIDVRARASGAFRLNLSIESPDGRIELGSAQYDIRSTAVSGLGIVISVAAIVVLGVWWVRTARRARAAHHDPHG